MRQLTFKGGPCDGMTATVEDRDAIAVLRAAPLDDDKGGRRVFIPGTGTTLARGDFEAAHARLVEYFRWPAEDGATRMEYRSEPPPRYAYGFSASD